ncbi:MAG: tRNA lysidine(34) synthetase TilS [Hyphomicrobiaceae bacterium]
MPAVDAGERHAPLGREGPPCAGEIDRLFAPLAGLRRLGLAVSGGADSMALMALAVEWARRGDAKPFLHVLTVDHRLRVASTAEAQVVLGAARGLGLSVDVLTWSEDKPASGVAAAARAARYRLLAEAARAERLDAVVTAHTEDDQAETLLMRLARGSGLDGLAGIPARSVIGGLLVLRPLLAVPHARLVAALEARGLGWLEDPSNSDPRYERIRIRAARPALAALGVTNGALAESARRLARARAAVDAAVVAQFAPPAGVVHLDDLGFAAIDWAKLRELAEEVRLRVLSALIERVAAPREQVSLRRLEALTEARGWVTPAGRTLAGACFMGGTGEADGQVLVVRELARHPPGELLLAPGATVVWDGRFRLTSTGRSPPVSVAALGRDGLAAIEAAGFRRPRLPARVFWALPACRDASGAVVAVPALGHSLSHEGDFTCDFRGREGLMPP